MNEIEKEIRKKIATEIKKVTTQNSILTTGVVLAVITGETQPTTDLPDVLKLGKRPEHGDVNCSHEQEIRDLIYLRESEGKPIWEIAERIEKLLRKVIADRIEAEIDADVWASAYQKAANIARGLK